MSDRIYLDNAATSWPKPDVVYEAVDRYQRELGCAVGRGATRCGEEVQRVALRCRQRIDRLLEVGNPNNIVFGLNGTDVLNMAIHGMVREGDHVVTTCWDHNSVLRPLHELASTGFIKLTILGGASDGTVDLVQANQVFQDKVDLFAISHASNVTGQLLPVNELAKLARGAGANILLDAAQSVGHLPISMKQLDVDVLACPGHKGLLGPLGTGVLAIKPGFEENIKSTRQGGTGTTSESLRQPESMPEKLESGNHNAPGIFGLDAACGWLLEVGVDKIHEREQALVNQLIAGMTGISKIQVHGRSENVEAVGVVSVSFQNAEPQVVSSLLDQHFGIETRAGLHCSPLAHQTLRTFEGGTVRFSVGPFTTAEQIDRTLEAVAQIATAM